MDACDQSRWRGVPAPLNGGQPVKGGPFSGVSTRPAGSTGKRNADEPADQKIAEFLKATNELEQHLHGDGPLTPVEYQTIETTIMGLQTLLQSWSRKQGSADTLSVMGQITRRNAEES